MTVVQVRNPCNPSTLLDLNVKDCKAPPPPKQVVKAGKGGKK